MLVIYDLDKTSCYCPIADWLDNFIPRNKTLKKLYYLLYPIAHEIEMKFNLFQVNLNMRQRARQYDAFDRDIRQVVLTARHFTKQTEKHVQRIFGDLPVVLICVAQGITHLSKAEVASMLPIDKSEEVIMYDDNISELAQMQLAFKKKFTGIQVNFQGYTEDIKHVY